MNLIEKSIKKGKEIVEKLESRLESLKKIGITPMEEKVEGSQIVVCYPPYPYALYDG